MVAYCLVSCRHIKIFQTSNTNIFELLQTNSTFISNQIYAGTIIGSTGYLVRALSGIWLKQCGNSRHSISSTYITRHPIYPIEMSCKLYNQILNGEVYKFMVKDPQTQPPSPWVCSDSHKKRNISPNRSFCFSITREGNIM